MRSDGRNEHEIRKVTVEKDFIKHAEGSVLISMGETKVICNASVEEKVPHFLKGEGKGWITAEYSMLPRATQARNIREAARGKLGGRTHEIQRLIGRALRSVVDIESFGERTIWIDCDVIQADGGTRTASITGAFIAMTMAFQQMLKEGTIDNLPINNFLAAVSVGLVNDRLLVDLNFEEDSNAQADLNIAMTDDRRFVEFQGTGEAHPIPKQDLSKLLNMAEKAIGQLIDVQKEVLGINEFDGGLTGEND